MITRLRSRRQACEATSSFISPLNLKRTAGSKRQGQARQLPFMSHRHSVVFRMRSRTTALECRNRRRVSLCHRVPGLHEANLCVNIMYEISGGKNLAQLASFRAIYSPIVPLSTAVLTYPHLVPDPALSLASLNSFHQCLHLPTFLLMLQPVSSLSSLASAYRPPWTSTSQPNCTYSNIGRHWRDVELQIWIQTLCRQITFGFR